MSIIERLGLVDVSVVNQKIKFDIRYKTLNNFTGEMLYDIDYRCLLRKETANKLNGAQMDLEILGYGLKVFDAYRP